jgi:hypothetical protein
VTALVRTTGRFPRRRAVDGAPGHAGGSPPAWPYRALPVSAATLLFSCPLPPTPGHAVAACWSRGRPGAWGR